MENFNFALLTTEIVVALMSLGLLVIGLIIPKGSRQGMFSLTIFGLLGLLVYNFYDFFFGPQDVFMYGMYFHDQFSTFFKILFIVTALLVVLSSKNYVHQLKGYRGEFYPLLLAATLGMMLMAGAGDLITMYIGLELMTITFYILVAYNSSDKRSAEAGIKYLVLGASSSAILLYGVSFIYGLTGSTQLNMVAQYLGTDITPVTLLATVFFLAGLGFKISLIPFHMWAPDIYEGAPTPITAYLSTASKAAGFAVLVRFYLLMMYNQNFSQSGQTLLLILAALSMIFGNLMAIPQKNVQRLMAYSGIAQAGYVLVGIIAVSVPAVSVFIGGVKAVLFYLMIYAIANLGIFTVITHVAQNHGSTDISAFEGLAKRAPLAAATFTVSVLSLAGIPLFAGFVGKFYLFSAVMNQGYVWIAFVGFIMSMVSVYYYLSVVKAMYRTEGAGLPDIPVHGASKFTMVFTMVTTLFLGVYPTPLAQMAINAAASLVR